MAKVVLDRYPYDLRVNQALDGGADLVRERLIGRVQEGKHGERPHSKEGKPEDAQNGRGNFAGCSHNLFSPGKVGESLPHSNALLKSNGISARARTSVITSGESA